jgi:uncharacterized membrane protein HdeD (DUF308 family)
MNLMLIGAIAMAFFTAGLFFLRSWTRTRDRFFLFFAIAFGIEGVGRVILGLTDPSDETEPLIYLIRLLAFSIILFAIVDKNRGRKPQS